MNAEQLHTVSTIVIDDVQETEILRHLSKFSSALNSLSTNPGDENSQRHVRDIKLRLFDSLERLKLKRWPAGLRQTIAELGGPNFDSDEIKTTIEKSLQTEAMTPATVRERVDEISSEITTFVGKLETLNSAFSDLGIVEQQLQSGEVELGVLIPRRHIDNRLDKFAEEVANFDRALKSFSVVATGTREDFAITYISASDLKFHIRPSLETATLISTIVMTILTSLNEVAELRLNAERIRELGMEEKYLEQISEGIENRLRNGIEEKLPGIIEKYSADKPEPEKNENLVHLRHAVDFFAPRLERGFVVEIRVGSLPKPGDRGEGEDEDTEHASSVDQNLVDELQDQAQRLKFIEPIGEPLLALNKPDENIVDDSSGKNDQ